VALNTITLTNNPKSSNKNTIYIKVKFNITNINCVITFDLTGTPIIRGEPRIIDPIKPPKKKHKKKKKKKEIRTIQTALIIMGVMFVIFIVIVVIM
jgi:hypothetical protein